MTRFVGFSALLLAACVLFGSVATGDEGKKSKDIDAIFRKLDTNMDGRLSKDEFLKIADRFRDKEKARSQLAQTYDKVDPNQKGITRDQFRSLVETTLQKRDGAANKKGER
jgi:Ca2+-binding EF-hand superfamily protein